ncbi:MAG: WecB/TagA/CpsF family glycosyltransferase [Phycisphaerales bacterium]
MMVDDTSRTDSGPDSVPAASRTGRLPRPSRPVVVEAPPARSLPMIRIDGVPIHAVDEDQANAAIIDALADGRGGFVVTHNLDHLRRLRLDPEFAALCDAAELRVADGMPLVWAAALRGTPLPARVAGSSMILTLSERAAAADRSVFLLGGDPGSADAAAEELQRRFPGLRVAGTLCPPMGFERDEAFMADMRRQLAESGADIVYVALGSPKQEQLAAAVRDCLPNAWWIGVGISFSFVAGTIRRAPNWMQRSGLEWVHRMAQEPRRLAGRYLRDGVPYAARLLGRSVMERGRHGDAPT